MMHGGHPASVNPNSKMSLCKKVRISQTEVETKRLVLAFESRIPSEITWALNTLLLFSCNSSILFCLDAHPYLLDSVSNYLSNCISNVTSIALTDMLASREIIAFSSSVPTLVDTAAQNLYQAPKIEYKSYPSFSEKMRKRDSKYDDKQKAYAAQHSGIAG